MLKLHKWKLLLITAALNLTILIALILGEVKTWPSIDWLDIVGEGGVSLLAALWLLFTLNSRPEGAITNLLSAGLALIFIGTFQDLMDEVIALPDNSFWHGGLESTLMPLGLVILTFGLYHWHKEQLLFNAERRKREQKFREYRLHDRLTGLGDARYLERQLERMLRECRRADQPLSLVLVDLDHFDQINRDHGHREGDRLLNEIAELILLNLRRSDLLCRYAGDRYAVILPHTGQLLAEQLAGQLTAAIEYFAFKTTAGETVYHTASSGFAVDRSDTPESLIARATRTLLTVKDNKQRASSAA